MKLTYATAAVALAAACTFSPASAQVLACTADEASTVKSVLAQNLIPATCTAMKFDASGAAVLADLSYCANAKCVKAIKQLKKALPKCKYNGVNARAAVKKMFKACSSGDDDGGDEDDDDESTTAGPQAEPTPAPAATTATPTVTKVPSPTATAPQSTTLAPTPTATAPIPASTPTALTPATAAPTPTTTVPATPTPTAAAPSTTPAVSTAAPKSPRKSKNCHA